MLDETEGKRNVNAIDGAEDDMPAEDARESTPAEAEELFTLRPAREDDLPLVRRYAFEEGMDEIPGTQGVTVAVNDGDIPVGFIRVVESPRWPGVVYVNPVVTYEAWRGYGVGRALMGNAMARCADVRLVARGWNVAFYEALGFVSCAWELIETDVTESCDGCPMLDECQPVPMRWVSAG